MKSNGVMVSRIITWSTNSYNVFILAWIQIYQKLDNLHLPPVDLTFLQAIQRCIIPILFDWYPGEVYFSSVSYFYLYGFKPQCYIFLVPFFKNLRDKTLLRVDSNKKTSCSINFSHHCVYYLLHLFKSMHWNYFFLCSG